MCIPPLISFVKVYRSIMTGTGANGYHFSLQGHQTISIDMSGGTTIAFCH
jgi:hypothetical protein